MFRLSKKAIIALLIVSWFFSGWPPIGDFQPPIPLAQASVSYQSPGSLAYSSSGGASIAPAFPSAISSGDLLVMIIGMKPSVANGGSAAAPNGWSSISGGSLLGAGGYGTTLGGDTGNTNVFSFYKVAVGTESGSQTVTLTANGVSWGQIYRFSSSSGLWDVAATTGSDISNGSVSIGMSANPGVTAGDYIIGGMVIPTDVTTPSQFSAEALSQAGIIFGSVAEISEPDSSTGSDIGGFTFRAAASSGTATNAPTLTATAGGTNTNVRGPGIFIRVREFVPPVPSAPTLYADDGGANQIAFNGSRQNDTTPIVRASAVHAASFNRFQVEFNTSSDFTGTARTETFSGTYSSGTPYNLQTTAALGLPSIDGATYYIRARASADGGSSYSDWSTALWSYAYAASGNADWHQTTDAQFGADTLASVAISGSGSVRLNGGSISKIGTDTSATDAGAKSSTSFSHTLVSGTNRLVAVSIGLENSGDIDVSSVNYGGVPMTKAVDAISEFTGTYIYSADIWYLLEADLPADGAKTVQIAFSTTTSSDMEVNAFASEYASVEQAVPESVHGYAEAASSDATIENTLSPSPNALVISAVGCGNAGNFPTHNGGQVAVLNFTDTSSGFAVTELRGASGGATTLTSAFSATANRMARVAASWGAASPSGTIMSTEIDYDWGVGQTNWGLALFSTTETEGDIKLKIYYTVSSPCDTIVPDSALPGNSSGFDVSNSPISLAGLTPVASTYNKICLHAALSTGGNTPSLDAWSVAWSSGIVSVSVSDGIVSYGNLPPGGAKTTQELGDTQLLTNDGSRTETFSIKGQNAACPWTLASASGANAYVHGFCKRSDSSCVSQSDYVPLTTSYQTLYTGVSAAATKQLDLRVVVPSDSSCFNEQGINVTIMATQ